jgi:dihydroflavonol-4-reductase
VTFRDERRLRALEGVAIDPLEADVLDRASLCRGLEGCDVMFHTAGLVASRPPDRVWRINAVAPRIAVEAAAQAGVRRVVLTSSVAAIGPAPPGRPGHERDQYPTNGSDLVYADSKHEGERAAFAAGRRFGVEVVAVNPAYVLGVPVNRSLAGETSTRIVGNYMLGRLPAIVDSHTNVVDVEDVAEGHLLAASRGVPGERYILGGQNLRWVEVIERIARLSGRRHPVLVLPPELSSTATALKRLGLPGMPLEGIRIMAPDWRYSSARAKRELGYSARSANESLARTVDWYMELVDDGVLRGRRTGRFDLWAAGLRTSERLGLLRPVEALGRLANRRVVAP